MANLVTASQAKLEFSQTLTFFMSNSIFLLLKFYYGKATVSLVWMALTTSVVYILFLFYSNKILIE